MRMGVLAGDACAGDAARHRASEAAASREEAVPANGIPHLCRALSTGSFTAGEASDRQSHVRQSAFSLLLQDIVEHAFCHVLFRSTHACFLAF